MFYHSLYLLNSSSLENQSSVIKITNSQRSKICQQNIVIVQTNFRLDKLSLKNLNFKFSYTRKSEPADSSHSLYERIWHRVTVCIDKCHTQNRDTMYSLRESFSKSHSQKHTNNNFFVRVNDSEYRLVCAGRKECRKNGGLKNYY